MFIDRKDVQCYTEPGQTGKGDGAMERKNAFRRIGKNGLPEKFQLFFMLLPFLILVLIFSYLPLYGWRYAFYSYRPGFGLDKSPYVGLYWF